MDSQDFEIFDGDLSADRLAAYQSATALSVDTETMGLNPIRDRLCLVQICDERDRVTVVRIAKGQTTAPNMQQLFEASHIPKIFHFARFDITTLQHYLGIYVQPIFCTKIASKLVRTYGPRHGLKDLIQETVGVELDKSSQCSDWGNAANLSDKQLQYASNDVRYLIPARAKLIEMLQREERLELAEQCFKCLPTFANLDLMQYQNLFEH
ncbi:ribonuclease D [filamentous cyanobacterium LEGE 11480]|uniref:Ribonuclease D n=1 Tax=Romeriopsis navalis LEGE 11480 TaxID=2777977 RepID=A0A928Z4T6_9CYAN|nr:ribonuclease H-like domain-containing protein [Romeriopsis navalis]MBE9032089.1 ribonuclease D [Romeriopsis navalis LEGE 11480]